MRNYGSEHFLKNGPNSHMGFPGSSAGKEYTCNTGNLGSIPGSGRTTGEGIGYPLQYSWALLVAQLVKNPPAMRETWVQPLGWENPWRMEHLPTPVFLPGEFHGLYSPWVTEGWTRLSDFHFHIQQSHMRTFHPIAAKCTFFSNTLWAFSRIDHLLSHKTSLKKFKKSEIISVLFSNYKGVKLDIINNKKKNWKTQKYRNECWKWSYMPLNHQWVKEDQIFKFWKSKFWKFLEIFKIWTKMETQNTKSCEIQQKSGSKREVYNKWRH